MDFDFLRNMAHAIPFVGMVVRGDDRNRPLITRLIESSVPGIIVALILMYTGGQTRQVDIDNIKKKQDEQTQSMIRIEDRVDKIQLLILQDKRSGS